MPHDNMILKRIETSYPWKPCRERMTCNRDQVEKLQFKTESSMIRYSTVISRTALSRKFWLPAAWFPSSSQYQAIKTLQKRWHWGTWLPSWGG